MASAFPPILDRAAIARTAQALIDLLDMIDGDPDFEEFDAEDSFALSAHALAFAEGPGCISSDCDHEHDGREEENGC